MLPLPNGQVVVGGGYDFVDGVLTSKVRRLSADGSPDASFNPGGGGASYGLVQALALQPDGKIVVGGSGMDGYNGIVTTGLTRLNTDGTVDTGFNAGAVGFGTSQGSGFIVANQGVRSLAVQPDGKVLVGGAFGSYNGQTVSSLMRLNPDGSIDATFATGTGIRMGTGTGRVEALLVQADGKILVGGSFDSYNGQTVGNVVRLNTNGSRDASFALQSVGVGPTNQVRALVQQPDGKLLIGGVFSQANGQASPNLLRLQLNGALDNTFSVGSAAQNSGIYKLRLQPDGSVLVMGDFTQFNGAVRGGLAKVSSTGTLDAALNAGGAGSNALVYDAVPVAGGQLLIGGTFTSYHGVARTGLARISQSSGSVDPAYNPIISFRGSLNMVAPLNTGQIVIAGDFDQFNGRPVASGAMHLLNADGSYNAVFAPGIAPYQYVQPDGRIYVSTINSSSNTGTITRHLPSGTADASFAPVTVVMDPTQRSALYLRVTPTGELLLMGGFLSVNGTARGKLAKVSATGALDPSFIPVGAWQSSTATGNLDAWPLATGQVYVCWDDNGRSNLVRLNATGILDNTFVNGSGPYTSPNVTANYYRLVDVQPNGQPFVQGNFTSFSGQPALNLVRLRLSGAPDPTFTAALTINASSDVRRQPDGRLLVSQFSGSLNSVLRRLNADGSIDGSFQAVSIPNSVYITPYGQVLQPQDGKILIYGRFSTVNGQVRVGLARLTNTLLAARPAFAAAPDLDVFPNPATAQITLRLPAAAASASAQPVELLDMQGRLVRQFTLPARQTEATFPLADVTAGIYLLQTSTAKGLTRQRVVVTR
jgi:uncharacterized delta-60 repeat protein